MSSKPMVSLPNGTVDWPETAKATFQHLAKTGSLFLHEGETSKVVAYAGASPAIKKLTAAEAVSTFERHVSFFINDKKKSLTKEVASILLAAEEKAALPLLRGISNSPILRVVNDALLPTPLGYDPVTQHYYVGAQPLEVDPQEAKAIIRDTLLGDFHFETPADRSRALALFLLPALKQAGLIQGRTPIAVIEANQAGTGKGYFDALRAACYGYRIKEVGNQKGGVGSHDEAFSDKLKSGCPFVQLDNLRGSYDSVLLEQFATGSGLFGIRLVGIGYKDVDREKFFISITSNGFETTPDLASRCLFIRLRHRGATRFTTFPEGDLLEHVLENQPRFLGAIFAVIREWHECGCNRTCDNRIRNGFHDGIQAADWIVQSLFNLPPVLDGHEEIQRRIASKNLGWLRRLCNTVSEKNQLGVELRAGGLGAIAMNARMDVPGVPASAMDNEDRIAKAIGTIMKEVFQTSAGDSVDIEGYTITREIRRDPSEFSTSGSNEHKYYVIREHAANGDAGSCAELPVETEEEQAQNTPLPAECN